jgi:hypothetical protein
MEHKTSSRPAVSAALSSLGRNSRFQQGAHSHGGATAPSSWLGTHSRTSRHEAFIADDSATSKPRNIFKPLMSYACAHTWTHRR